MTAERIQVPAIRYHGGVMIPQVDEEVAGCYVAEQSGCGYWRNGDEIRRWLDEMGSEDLADCEAESPGWAEAHRMLADLIDELMEEQ